MDDYNKVLCFAVEIYQTISQEISLNGLQDAGTCVCFQVMLAFLARAGYVMSHMQDVGKYKWQSYQK